VLEKFSSNLADWWFVLPALGQVRKFASSDVWPPAIAATKNVSARIKLVLLWPQGEDRASTIGRAAVIHV